MSANTVLKISELDFDTIKENLKTFLRSQSEFQDYDFEGSGMSVLLDILAYNTHYMGYYLNVIGNEMFLDTAQIRQSVISHAKMINYVPESKHGSQAKINITVTPSVNEDQVTSVITLEKYTKLLGTDIDGINYPFVTIDSNTTSKVSGSFNFSNVIIHQGEAASLQYDVGADNPKRRFEIPSSNIDTDTLIVTVQESESNTYTETYVEAKDLLDITANSLVYFVEENENGNYSFYFGDGIIGKRPRDGNIVTCIYIDVAGSQTNKINNFTFIENVGGLYSDNVTVTSTGASYSGSEREAIETVKFRAPYAYSTQNRAVTKYDYENLILKDYTNLDSVAVWGGEENVPPVYGKVYLSLKTKENYALTNLEKENIKESLITTRNILTVIPEIVDPEFTYVLLRGSAYYNPTLTSLSSEQIKTFVRAASLDYRTDELGKFTSTFRKSKLQNYIEGSEKSITGSDIKIYLQKRILLDTTQVKKYTINTEFPIKKGDFSDKISTFPGIYVKDSSNITREVNFEEVPEAFTGVDGVDIINPGFNYTSTPTVTIVGDGSGATAVATVVGGRITEIDITNRGINYTRATISITGGGGTQAVAVARLESKFGRLRTFYTKDNGEKVIVNNNAGTVNYETGLIELLSLSTTGTVPNEFYDQNTLTFQLPITREIITPLRNRIVDIDENDPKSIQIDVIAET